MVGFDRLFEISFEVCNKVGGIYTVLSSKARFVAETYKNKYITIGPYFEANAEKEFIENQPPEEYKAIFSNLLQKGIKVHYGNWDIKGKPLTILIETNEVYNANVNMLKAEYWSKYKLDSLGAGYDFNEPMLWSSAVAEFIIEFSKFYKNDKIVAHAHEWLSGFSIMKLKGIKNIKTVFTTHATMLARTISNYGYNVYDDINKYDPMELAYKYNIQSKHLTEKICANIADCFTTVSKITAIETEHFYGKIPDVITENGLDKENFYNSEKTIVKQLESKKSLKEFISYYFSPFYQLDTDKSIILFISGRYEFKNKGIDLFIKSLGKLNNKLKELNFNKNIVVFFLVPRDVNSINNLILYQKSKYRHFKTLIDKNIDNIKSSLLKNIMSNTNVSNDLFSDEFLDKIRKSQIEYFEGGLPPLSAFNFNNFDDDNIIKSLNCENLLNRKEDVVRVIDYPIYLDGNDGLLDMDYEEVVLGCDLGIFPSYYEPWGYTPLENAVLGIPSVTCDVAGYGNYILNLKSYESKGIFLVNRKSKSQKEIVDQLFNILYNYVKLDQKSLIEHKIVAKRLSELTDWNILYKKYKKAYDIAINK